MHICEVWQMGAPAVARGRPPAGMESEARPCEPPNDARHVLRAKRIRLGTRRPWPLEAGEGVVFDLAVLDRLEDHGVERADDDVLGESYGERRSTVVVSMFALHLLQEIGLELTDGSRPEQCQNRTPILGNT